MKDDIYTPLERLSRAKGVIFCAGLLLVFAATILASFSSGRIGNTAAIALVCLFALGYALLWALAYGALMLWERIRGRAFSPVMGAELGAVLALALMAVLLLERLAGQAGGWGQVWTALERADFSWMAR